MSTLEEKNPGSTDGNDNEALRTEEHENAVAASSEEESSQDDSSSGAVVVGISKSARVQADGSVLKKKTSLQRLLQKFDLVLKHYVNFTSTAGNQERSLKLLQWNLWLLGYLKKSSGLRKLYLDVSWARYILRLLGFPASLEAARTGSWGQSSSTTMTNTTMGNTRQWWISKLGSIMAYSMMFYYPSEHVAYLGWKSPDVLPRANSRLLRNANLVSAYSCRCWLVYLIAEMSQSILKLQELLQQRKRLLEEDKADGEGVAVRQVSLMNASTTTPTLLQQSIHQEQLQLVRSLLFTLPCIHWSLPKWDTDPWLREGVVNGLMWLESVVSMYQALVSYTN